MNPGTFESTSSSFADYRGQTDGTGRFETVELGVEGVAAPVV